MQKATWSEITLWILLALFWSSSYAVIKSGIETVDPVILVAGRMMIGACILLIALKIRGMSLSRVPSDWRSYAITGLLGSALPFLFITYGEQSVDSALAAILIAFAPVATVFLAACFIPTEPLTWRIFLAVVGGFVGVAMLVGPSAMSGLGDGLLGQSSIIAAACCYAASTIYIRLFVTKPPLEMATGAAIVGTIFLLVISFFAGGRLSSVNPTLPSLGAILYLGIFSTAFANLIYFYLVPRLGATRMSQVNFVIPVGGAVFGWILLGEVMTLQRSLALIVILVSVYFGTSKSKPTR
ncbi:DMT family transporter [Paracoccaceae bacterium GXU_MW_L88]